MPQRILSRVLFVILFITLASVCLAGQESPRALEEIVVSKVKSHNLSSYPLEYHTLRSLAFGSFLEALSTLPLDLQSRSPKGSLQTDFSLRGSNFQQVLVALNGQRINDPQTAHYNADIPFTSEDIERVEVIPSAGSSLFGPDAISGTIQVLLKEPQGKKRILESSGGQYQLTSNLLSITQEKDGLAGRFSLENQESDGFYTDTDFKKFTATAATKIDIPYGKINLNFGYQEKEFGAFDFYTPGFGFLSKEWTKTYLLDSGLDFDTGGLLIKPHFLWRRHFDKFMLDKTQQRSRHLSHHRTDIFTPSIYAQKKDTFLGTLGLGLEYGEEKIKSTNIGKHERSRVSAFLDTNKDITERLALAMAFRLDDYDNLESVQTGSLYATYKLSERDLLHIGSARNIRLAPFTELFYSDPVSVGNPDLSIEESLNYEAGYAFKKNTLYADVTFFFRDEDDAIDWVKRSRQQARWRAENITTAKALGLEGSLRYSLNKYISLDTNYTYVDKRIKDRGYLYKYGFNYIRHLANVSCIFNLPFGTQSLSMTYKKKPVRDGWFSLSARLSKRINKNAEVFFRATNLLNVEYQEIEGIPQPGRWVEAGIRLEW